jgi:hypothetical protein
MYFKILFQTRKCRSSKQCILSGGGGQGDRRVATLVISRRRELRQCWLSRLRHFMVYQSVTPKKRKWNTKKNNDTMYVKRETLVEIV